MPEHEAPTVELGSAPPTPSAVPSPTPSEVSTASSPEPQFIQPTPLFRALAIPPPDPDQPMGQDELERRLPGYRRIVIPRELTLLELLKQDTGASTDEEVLVLRVARLRVVAERVGLRRLHVLVPRLRELTLDGSALCSLRDLGIGLVHLKVLSVCRCGLRCLDGVWGLGALRELRAAGNKLRELHALAALQKLHTLDLADNPIEESVRLWTLSVCVELRRLTLAGAPLADYPDYRSRVAATLPMLLALDGEPLHEDFQDEPQILEDSGSETEPEPPPPPKNDEPGPSEEMEQPLPDEDVTEPPDESQEPAPQLRRLRRRPATADCARASRPAAARRPRTAPDRPAVEAPPRLQILNTLMDEEWRCSGSKLTSRAPVCGNLARALRRPATANAGASAAASVAASAAATSAPTSAGAATGATTAAVAREEAGDSAEEHPEQSLGAAVRALAAEIPRAPHLADWDKFRQDTGIDIDIDFNSRPEGADAMSAIERLEQIEKETSERLNNNDDGPATPSTSFSPPARFGCSMTIMRDFEQWRDMHLGPIPHPSDVNSLFTGINANNEARDFDTTIRSIDQYLLDE